jgi:hypothetical protein
VLTGRSFAPHTGRMGRHAASDIYEHNRTAASDDGFEIGRLEHLVAGNRGRLLDPRRTPVTITGLDLDSGMFGVVIEAFEDKGARWRMPFEDVANFQFERKRGRVADDHRDELQRIVGRFDRKLEVPATSDSRAKTLRDLERERALVRAELRRCADLRDVDLAACIEEREGSRAAATVLESLMEEAGLAALERSLAETYVSNPHSGEMVKGHAIVVAEMGLCPYSGKVVRDAALFEGQQAKELRRAHILLRLAFVHELMSFLSHETVELYRGIAIEGSLSAPCPATLVAATFSRRVAMSHFEGGPTTNVAVLARQQVQVSRLFMTFIETQAMNEHYREAEAVLIGEPKNLAF